MVKGVYTLTSPSVGYHSLVSGMDRSAWISPSLLPRYDGPSSFSHLREQEKLFQWQLLVIQRLTRGHGTLLLCCGDVEQNPGPAGADEDKPGKSQLTAMHVNARSLLCHRDDVAALPQANRPTS